MGKKFNTTPVPLGTKEGALCTYLANKTNRAYARLEMYARLPGVKPQNIPDWSLLREHTHARAWIEIFRDGEGYNGKNLSTTRTMHTPYPNTPIVYCITNEDKLLVYNIYVIR